MIQKLKVQMITRPRFSLLLEPQNVYELLRFATEVETKKRGREFFENKELAETLEKVASWLTDDAETKKPWLMLAGCYGNGKTTIARAVASIVNSYLEVKNRNRKTFMAFFDATDIYDADSDAPYRAQIRAKAEIPLLTIDDLGCEPVECMSFGNYFLPSSDLLMARYENQNTTIVTTNLTTDELRERYGARVYDRFREMFELVIVKSKSYRK